MWIGEPARRGMGLKDRVTKEAAKASTAARTRIEGSSALQRLLADADQAIKNERLLVGFVRAVRTDEPPAGRTEAEFEKATKRRRQRLGALPFATGPLVGVGSQVVDLYCDTATMCDLVAFHGLELTDEEIAAHMLVLWSVTDDFDVALAAVANGGVPALVTVRLAGQASTHLPEVRTPRGAIKAIWQARALTRDVREKATSGPVKAVLMPGKATRALIARGESQLGVRDELLHPESKELPVATTMTEAELSGVLQPGERVLAVRSAGGVHASEHDFHPANPHVLITDRRLCFVSKRGMMKKKVELDASWPLGDFTSRLNFSEGTALGPFMHFLTLFTQSGETVSAAFMTEREREEYKEQVVSVFD